MLPVTQVNEIDYRGCTFYLALYWAQALAAQGKDAEMKERLAKVAADLEAVESEITEELLAAQGDAVDIDGYYRSDETTTEMAMRPSATLNAIVDGM